MKGCLANLKNEKAIADWFLGELANLIDYTTPSGTVPKAGSDPNEIYQLCRQVVDRMIELDSLKPPDEKRRW